MKTHLLLLVMMAALMTGCNSRKSPEITIANASDAELRDIVVRGNGYRTIVDILPPGGSKTFTVNPPAESEVAVEMATPKGYVSTGGLAYFEPRGGYFVHLVITPEFKVEASAGIRPMF